MPTSFQNIVPLRTEHRQVILVEPHHLRLVFDARRHIALVDNLSLSDDRIGQLDGRTI